MSVPAPLAERTDSNAGPAVATTKSPAESESERRTSFAFSFLAASPVIKVVDYLEPEKTKLPKSDVLQFFSKDGSVVSVRPSGTEPKIKFYFGVHGEGCDEKIEALRAQFSGKDLK